MYMCILLHNNTYMYTHTQRTSVLYRCASNGIKRVHVLIFKARYLSDCLFLRIFLKRYQTSSVEMPIPKRRQANPGGGGGAKSTPAP